MHKTRRILALETSGEAGAVALATGRALASGGREDWETNIVSSVRLPGEMRHAAELLPAVERVLKNADWAADSITEVFVSIGPGSFTGLRIGVSVARTLAWSVGAAVVAVPTMDVVARNALAMDCPPAYLATILDAKRSQVFAAAFELTEAGYRRTMDPCLAGPVEFFQRCGQPLAVLGEGVPAHERGIVESKVLMLDSKLWAARAENVVVVGNELARKGRFTPAGDLLPLYVRRPDPVEKWEKLHG